jgi:hypothetical protein
VGSCHFWPTIGRCSWRCSSACSAVRHAPHRITMQARCA